MKIGIISLFGLYYNVNYGNRLQAYALNKYISNNFKNCEVHSLYMEDIDEKRVITCKKDLLLFLKCTLRSLKRKVFGRSHSQIQTIERLERFNQFCKENIKMCEKPMNWKSLCNSDYDIFIVGSDIIWGQWSGEISKIRFLDFENQQNFKKVSYGASFGRDWIPEENIPVIKKYLDDFDYISVRESSSVRMLSDIGENNAVHTLDPTLLISNKEWSKIEKKPDIDVHGKDYIFVYLLSEKESRSRVLAFAKEQGLRIVTIPYATGRFNDVDKDFGDIQVMNCSIEEWIWLIHHAEYIITDSFHGTVFSTIFNKKFFILKRSFVEDINNRMLDYLNIIQQNDKFTDLQDVKIESFEWNYDLINGILEEKKKNSREFLKTAIEN